MSEATVRILTISLLLLVISGIGWGDDQHDTSSVSSNSHIIIKDCVSPNGDGTWSLCKEEFNNFNFSQSGDDKISFSYEDNEGCSFEVKLIDIIKSLRLADKYLKKSTYINNTYAVYKTPAQGLREQADFLEQKDKDIDYIRSVLKKLECKP